MVIACFTPEASELLLVSEVGYVEDIFVLVGAFLVIVEGMAWQVLLGLLWCGSSYHMVVCGQQFSSLLKENHREHSVLPKDEKTAIGEPRQSV